MVHGDYQERSLFFAGEAVVAVIDWVHDHWLFAGTYARNDDRLRSSWNPDRSYRSSTTGRGLDRHSSD